MKIRSRLLWLVFVAWLPSALAIGVVARSAYVEQRDAVLAEVRKVADNLAGIVEREIDKRFVMARTLSSSSSLQSGNLQRFYVEAERATQGTGSWALLLTRTHQLLNTARPYEPGFSIRMAEGDPWLPAGEGIYFSMVTLSTVGFGDYTIWPGAAVEIERVHVARDARDGDSALPPRRREV